MGQCQSYYTVLVLGLSGAGKSTFMMRLEELTTTGHLTDIKPAPTIQFMRKTIRWGGHVLLMLELAGRLRDSWSTYFNHIHGLVYVMDMSLNSHLEEMNALREALFYKEESQRLLKDIPILLLLNKSQLFIRQTANDAEASLAIVRALNTEYLSWFEDGGEEPNPLQFVWTDAVSGGGFTEVDRLDWFVETIAIRQNPSMLQAIRSVIG